uniref:P13 n=1 Tax=Olivavirus actinidiae TaxID=2024724 RepID=A0A7L9CEP9_9CLOS|nr:P13 [Actinidia virus 1]
MGALFTVYESEQYVVRDNRSRYPYWESGYHNNTYYDDCGPGGSYDHSLDSLVGYYNRSDVQQHLVRRQRILSENLIERDNLYDAEIRKRNEYYAKHKRRSKKRFSLYSLLYR